jgi:hypothetical protein
MQLVQKHLPRKGGFKLALYLVLFLLAVSCKPFLYRQGIGFVFDYEVATNRLQRATNWLASQLASDNKPVVVYGGKK